MNKPAGFVVFDITDPEFYAGNLSLAFTENSDGGNKPWFFQPDDWAPKGDWYGSIAATLTETLMCYSMGYATPEEARRAANGWMIWIQADRERQAVRNFDIGG